MKVLLSAYACEPEKGSEPGVGWAWAHSLCEHVDVTVVTRANNKDVIEQWYRKQDALACRPTYIYHDPPKWAIWLKKKRLLPVQWFYVLWQLGVALRLKSKVQNFDLIHHVTFNSMMLPGFWWHDKIPVILGPLGGTSCVRKSYKILFGEKIWKENLREILINHWTYLPWLRMSFNRAKMILCANSETQRQISQRYEDKTKLMLETGINHCSTGEKIARNDEAVQFIWIGTIEPWKALNMALEAFSLALKDITADKKLHLNIVGQGSEMAAAQAQVEKLAISKQVTFLGWLPHEKVTEMIRESGVLLFTSVKDTSGNVVLEAMAQSTAVICLNHQGVGDITTEETAIRVEPDSMENTVMNLAKAIVTLASNQSFRNQLGEAGRQRVEDHYTWNQRAEKMAAMYYSIIQESRCA